MIFISELGARGRIGLRQLGEKRSNIVSRHLARAGHGLVINQRAARDNPSLLFRARAP